MKKSTRLAGLGREGPNRRPLPRTVNPVIQRASTVVFDSIAHMRAVQAAFDRDEPVPTYGIAHLPATLAFEDAVAALYGAHRAVCFPSGLAAVAGALLAFVEAGSHVLMTDGAYGPARHFAAHFLRRLGIETTFYDPLIGAGIADLLRDNTAAIYAESPSSLTFEVQDIPAIAQVARAHGATLLFDNAWATPLYFDAFAHGVDVVIEPVTKYIGGHSDLLFGIVAANARCWPRLCDAARDLGQCASPEDVFLAWRGLRTLDVRLTRQQESALRIARWLQTRPEVKRVRYPALPDDPGHALWRRDFTGASGLFGVELHPVGDTALAAMIDGYAHFALGYSWGGYESLVILAEPAGRRQRPWTGGPLVRYSIGLEDADDLIADLEAGFDRMHRV